MVQLGFYFSNDTSGKKANLFPSKNCNQKLELEKVMLSEQEITFLKLGSSELTYKEIAMKINLNPRAVDGLRDHLFDKLNIKRKLGLAMYAIQ